MRIAFAALLLLTPACSATDAIPDDFVRRAMALESHWNLFIRRLAGCPDAGEVSKELCKSPRTIDYGEFGRARKAAIVLFDLRER